jgi:hypothetical protein
MAFRSWDSTREQLHWYRDAGGTGPVILRGGPMLADTEHAAPPMAWTESRIVESLDIAAAEGIDEFAWDLNVVGYEPSHQVELLERLAQQIGLTPRTAPSNRAALQAAR